MWYPALKPPPSHLATLTPSPGHGIEATASGTTLMPLSCRFTSLFSSLDGFVKVGAGSSSLCIRALLTAQIRGLAQGRCSVTLEGGIAEGGRRGVEGKGGGMEGERRKEGGKGVGAGDGEGVCSCSW